MAPVIPGHNQLGHLAGQLTAQGWAILTDWPGAECIAALEAAALRHIEQDRTRPAAIGPIDKAIIDRGQRRAYLRWMAGSDAAETAYLDAAEALRLALNERLYLGLFDFEACYAIYPPGGFYVRHKDSFEGARNRIISVVTYLNRDWRTEDGGALIIYNRNQTVAAEILPRAGVSVLMLSEEIEHEVAPTNTLRMAIAGWWRIKPLQ